MKNLTFSQYPFVFNLKENILDQVEREGWYYWATSERKVEAPKPFKVEKREWSLISYLKESMCSWMP